MKHDHVNLTPFPSLACPLDGGPLHRDGSSWRCQNGHTFDIAKEGYTHLLPVQYKRSLDPGDSKEMVAARRRFLESGAYEPISQALNRIVLENLSAGQTLNCLDAGCGEGYYLRRLADAERYDGKLALLGLDISKPAVVSAAKRQKQITWVVATNAKLPVLTGTLDWVFCLFGFPVFGEFARVLKPGGRLLLVTAGSEHLKELRRILYPVLKTKPEGEMPIPEGFEPVENQTVRFTVKLENAASIADLLAMTPHLYRASSEGREKVSALTELSVTVDVTLSLLARSA